MDELAERAIEVCLEYDRAKNRIDELTEDLHFCFEACEKQKRENMSRSDYGSDINYQEAMMNVKPCLNMGYNGWDADCDHCIEAYRLIQERKEARQEFGIAKRRVRAVARSKRKLI